MTDPEFAAAIAAAFQAFNERRFADFATYVTEDVVESYQQSCESFDVCYVQLAFFQGLANRPSFIVSYVLRSVYLCIY
jgi:hypothetical protein